MTLKRTSSLTPYSRRLRRLRRSKGYTQAGLARALGVNNAQVSAWESAGTVPRISTRLKLEALLGDSIYNDEPPMVSRQIASVLSASVPKLNREKLPVDKFIKLVSKYVEDERDYLDIMEAYVTGKWERVGDTVYSMLKRRERNKQNE